MYSAPLAHQSTQVLSRQDFDVFEERPTKEILDFARGSEAISFLEKDRPFKRLGRVEGDSRAIPFCKLRFCLSEQSSCNTGSLPSGTHCHSPNMAFLFVDEVTGNRANDPT